MDFDDSADRCRCVSFWNVGIIFHCGGIQDTLARSKVNRWIHQRYSGRRLSTSNHSSWPKHLVHFHSTVIIEVVAIKPCIFKQNYPQLNQYLQLQVNVFLGEYVAPAMTSQWLKNVYKARPRQAPTWSELISRRFASVNEFVQSLCMAEKLSSIHFQSIRRIMVIESGIPVAIMTLSNLYNFLWAVCLQSTDFQWWHYGNRALLLAEKGIPRLRTAPSW